MTTAHASLCDEPQFAALAEGLVADFAPGKIRLVWYNPMPPPPTTRQPD